MSVDVKICGLSEPDTLEAAIDHGARWVGFIRFPKSPRHVSLEQLAILSRQAQGRARRVAVLVNPDEAEIDAVAPLVDALQLHGQETPDRAAQIRAGSQREVWKAFAVAEGLDADRSSHYAQAVDRFLFDAKPPKNSELPGGNGVSFDPALIQGRDFGKPWLLSGGLTAETLRASVKLSGARAVDVSSGVEHAPGVKNIDKIAALMRAALE